MLRDLTCDSVRRPAHWAKKRYFPSRVTILQTWGGFFPPALHHSPCPGLRRFFLSNWRTLDSLIQSTPRTPWPSPDFSLYTPTKLLLYNTAVRISRASTQNLFVCRPCLFAARTARPKFSLRQRQDSQPNIIPPPIWPLRDVRMSKFRSRSTVSLRLMTRHATPRHSKNTSLCAPREPTTLINPSKNEPVLHFPFKN